MSRLLDLFFPSRRRAEMFSGACGSSDPTGKIWMRPHDYHQPDRMLPAGIARRLRLGFGDSVQYEVSPSTGALRRVKCYERALQEMREAINVVEAMETDGCCVERTVGAPIAGAATPRVALINRSGRFLNAQELRTGRENHGGS
jgi:hypothetical protein